MTVTGTVLSWKAIPSRAGSGTQEQEGLCTQLVLPPWQADGLWQDPST